MNENDARPRANAHSKRRRATWFAGRSERLAMLVVGGILALAPAVGTTALAGSGGTGTGDGGGERAGGGDRWDRMWDRFSSRDKRWARQTSRCESGDRAKIHGGGGAYHGAFQFMLSTWRSSPKSPGGDPHKYRWKVQAVVAVKLKHRDGRGHWPNCG